MPPADNAAVKLQAISFCPVLPNLEVFTPDDAAVGEGEQNAFAPVVPRGSIPVQSVQPQQTHVSPVFQAGIPTLMVWEHVRRTSLTQAQKTLST